MLSVYRQVVRAQVLDHLTMLNCTRFRPNEWSCIFFFCQDTKMLLFFRKWRLVVFKISEVNNSISVFKFRVNKSDETLSCLSIGIRTVTCGRQVEICTVTRYYLCTVTQVALFCIKLS